MKKEHIVRGAVLLLITFCILLGVISVVSFADITTEDTITTVCTEIIETTIVETEETVYIEIPEETEEYNPWEEHEKEFPYATKVWIYMKENFGWSDAICAGIMGNIMAEIGGGTLDFSDWNWDKRTLGMFQWLGSRKTDIKKLYGEIPTIEEQLEFMYDELYGTDGVHQQVTDSQREKILSSETPEQAAKRFSDWFERPGNSGISRQGYARKAYNYFVD